MKAIFRAALRWAPDEREAMIAAMAAGDAAVVREVESLLAHHDGDEGEEEGGVIEAARRAAAGEPAWTLAGVIERLEPVAQALVTRARARDEGHAARVTAGSAPEQLVPARGPVGAWTDVYELAMLCVERMRGAAVSDGPAAAMARAEEEAVPPAPGALGIAVAPEVEAIFAMALAVRPMDRYQDVSRFWTALREAVARVPAPPRVEGAASEQGAAYEDGRRAGYAVGRGMGPFVGIAIVIGLGIVIASRCG